MVSIRFASPRCQTWPASPRFVAIRGRHDSLVPRRATKRGRIVRKRSRSPRSLPTPDTHTLPDSHQPDLADLLGGPRQAAGGTSPSCRGDLTDLPGELCQASWNSVTPRGLASLRLAVASHWPASPCSVSPDLQGDADALLPAGPARLRQHYPVAEPHRPRPRSEGRQSAPDCVALQTSRLQHAGSRHLGLARMQPPRLPMPQAAPAPGASRPAPGASRPCAGPPRSWRRAICSSTASAAHSLTSTRD